MLAYVFWHIPAANTDRSRYERLLIDFHKTLAAHPPSGFHSSLIFRTQDSPWIANGAPAYEDWYLLDNSSSLDSLNDFAVSGPRKGPHDEVASLASSGAAGLYRLKTGSLDSLKHARHALWFSKPALSYDAFFQQLRPQSEAPQSNLWLRQMVLSAAPEFCLRSAKRPELPASLPSIHCSIDCIHPT